MLDKATTELLFRDMYEALAELSIVLDKEYQALAEQDFEKIQQAIVDKEQLSVKIEALEQNRTELQQENGYQPNAQATHQFLTDISENGDDNLLTLWEMITDLAEKCQEQNQINGIIVDNNKRQIAQALSILQSGFTEQTELYGADGSSVCSQQNTTIAKA